jgi:hypothetical protein
VTVSSRVTLDARYEIYASTVALAPDRPIGA